jgi:D-3-phosphoglycerate dehydrogenase
VIGAVGRILGDAGINISDFHVGRSPSGAAALMAIATDSHVSAEVLQTVTACPGVQSARAIDLD